MSTIAYKFRFYPNTEQYLWLIQNFGCCRFVYNYYLNLRKNLYDYFREIINYYDYANDLKNLKQEYPWLKNADSIALQSSLRNLDNAFQNFFRGCKTNKHIGYPKFKCKHHKQSYTTKNNGKTIEIIDNKHIKLPKLGSIYCRVSRKVEGRILNATITMTSSGKFFVSICCTDVEIEDLPKTNNSIGIDLGIESMITDSNGKKYPNHKYLQYYEKKLKREQRKLSRKTKGSKRWEKQRLIVAKLYEKVSNLRRDYIQKVTTDIIKNNDIICIEKLNVQGMLKNHHLAKAISDVSFYEIKRELEYKAEWYGKIIQVVPTTYPSSQLCSRCGFQDKSMRDLKKRRFKCPNCGLDIDRDENASINVKTKGLKLLSETLTA